MTGREALLSRLSLLRRRMLTIGGVLGFAWALVAAVVLWLASVWLDLLWELSPAARLFSNVAAVAAGVALMALTFARFWRRSRDALLAQRVDQAGESGGQIIAGYELSQPAVNKSLSSDLSAGLAAMAVDRAAALAAAVPAAQAVCSRTVRTPTATFAALAAAVFCAVLVAPRLADTEWRRFFDPHGDNPPYSRVQFLVTPGDAQVLYGSGLDVLVTTDGAPVEQVDLLFVETPNAPIEPLAMFHQPDGTWRAVLTNITTSGKYYVRAGRSRSSQYALTVITVPTIEEVRFRVTPPAYTRRAAYEGPLPPSGLVGLAGTEVQVSAKSNRPLSGGTLSLASGSKDATVTLAPRAPDAHEVTGTFVLSSAGKFQISVSDVAGVSSQDVFVGSITLVADQRPLVRVIEPAAMALATPEATLPVVLAGEDDYGISRTQLFRSLNDSRGLAMDFSVPQPAATRYAPTQALPLSAYGLNAGDVIKLYARIEDNDPAGAKGSESPLCEVHIISQREFERMVRAREGLEALMSKYRQADRRLEALAAERDGLRKKLKEESGDTLSEAAAEGLSKLARQMRTDAASHREALEHLLPYDLDAALAERLGKLAAKLDEQAAAAEDLARSGSLTREELEQLLDEMERSLQTEREIFDKEAMEPLEHLEAVFPLIEDQSRFVDLCERQRDLSQRLASVKGRDGEDDPRLKARMRDLETEQQRLRVALGELLGDIENHASRLPADERLDDLRASALEFADGVRAAGAVEAMAEAEAGLAEFSGTRGHEAATRAADLLEQFIVRGSQVGQQGRMCLKFQPTLGLRLGNTIDQLLAEMGLGNGDGPGSGAGNGYSARRSTLSNVGLYGRLPGTGEFARSGARRGPGGAGGDAGGRPSDRDDPATLIDLPQKLRASGATGASIPAAYRRRVGAYFQRLAEESDSR